MNAKLNQSKVNKMSRYVNRNLPTVSQEFTVIELAISAGIIALAMKLLKSNEKKVEQVKPKLDVKEYDERKIINARYKAIIEALEQGATTSGKPLIYEPYWGKGRTVESYITHTANDYFDMVKKLVTKTNATLDSLVKENEKYEANQDNVPAIDDLVKKLINEIQSVVGKDWTCNTLHITPSHNVGLIALVDYDEVGAPPGFELPAPNEKEMGRLVILLGDLINYRSDLTIRVEAWPDSAWNGYAHDEISWISEVVDSLEQTAWYLSVYLMSSLGLKL
jgi:hypothetical protein